MLKASSEKVFKLRYQRQIVSSKDAKDETSPEEEAFLSDKNRKFRKQTVAPSGMHTEKSLSLSDLSAFERGHNPFNKPDQVGSKESEVAPRVDVSDETNLNTVEFKYYGYFQRIRQKLEHFWILGVRETIVSQFGSSFDTFTDSDRITLLRVTLDGNGNVTEIRLVRSSGSSHLDEAARVALTKPSPIPNPPKGLITDNRLTLDWGFIVSQ